MAPGYAKTEQMTGESRHEGEDEEILGRVRAGETRHFGELVLRHQDAIYGMARRFVGSPTDAEDRREVRAALAGLDEKYRSVVILHYCQKLSYEQIAAVLDMPLKTVETRLSRARRLLRVRLEESGRGGET